MPASRKSGLIVQFARALAVSGKMTAVVSIAVPQTINVAYAGRYDLPKPYVSRALDAVLIPINHASRHRYQIPPKLRGVYVLAVSPHGVAARQGIRPGDVLATVHQRPIVDPIDVDRIVWAALAVSTTAFLFGVNRGVEATDIVQVNTNITVNNFNTNVSVNNISSWTSVDNRQEWTQIVNQYNTDISTSISDTSYQTSVTNNGGGGIPEPGQNFDGTNRNADGIPEPGQNFDGTNRNADEIPEPRQDSDKDATSDDVDDDADDDVSDDADDDTGDDSDDDTGDDGDDSDDSYDTGGDDEDE